MGSPSPPVIVFPGAGGPPDRATFKAAFDSALSFEIISYPGWSRYVANQFSAESLVADLAAHVTAAVPKGPIRIVGISIGGHFGYAVALYLQQRGREIAAFCAIDTFLIASAAPSAGWKGRSLKRGLDLLRMRRIGEFARYARSLLWRALFRLLGDQLPRLLRRFCSSGRLPKVFAIDHVFEEELTVRLLIREVAPWISSLDREPIALKTSATLLRTMRLNARDDAAWRRRCPGIHVVEIPGNHQTLFEPDHVGLFHEEFLTATRDWH